MNQPIVTICMPCFGRPYRTLRVLNQLLEQDLQGWEAYIIGDGCPDFQILLESGEFDSIQKKAKGNKMVFSNLPIHRGGWGYEVRNKVKELATGKYFIYIDNDDCITQDHLSHYVSQIEGTDYDFIFFDTFIKPTNQIRVSHMLFGHIGHAELVVRSSFLKTMPPHNSEYGHDWMLISNMVRLGAKYKKSDSGKATYQVMGLGNFRETDVD